VLRSRIQIRRSTNPPSTLANQKISLLRLPPELRNKIYTYALGGEEILMKHHHNPRDSAPSMSIYRRTQHASHPLALSQKHHYHLLTSRQIHLGTKSMPFRLNTLSAFNSTWAFALPHYFLRHPQANAIRTVKLCLNSRDITAFPVGKTPEQVVLGRDTVDVLRLMRKLRGLSVVVVW
jgi:hypothetical protein